jgi:diguanylate cyclase (GGDEF)-like protein
MTAVSLAAIVASFALASSTGEVVSKSRGFMAIIVGYLVAAVVVYVFGNRNGAFRDNDGGNVGREIYADQQLFAIQEASEYFGGSLRPADMFRLVANKVNEILPFTACILYMVDSSNGCIRVSQAQGPNSEKLRDLETPIDAGLAGQCILSGLAQMDRGMVLTRELLPADAVAGFHSTAAVPLIRDGEAFAVLQFYSDKRTAFTGNSLSILEAVAERVAPMILGSMSFERSVSTAMTDPLTDLPNERAFRLVLENQIAESQRKREERPLTILAIDIKNFDELNSRFGHAAGDRVLGLVAQVVSEQLRQMDFFARASGDEFLAALPTADENAAADVIVRINTAILHSRFFVDEAETFKPELYFGVASFGKHGETADRLILAAHLNKQQSKASSPTKVVWFPKQFAD